MHNGSSGNTSELGDKITDFKLITAFLGIGLLFVTGYIGMKNFLLFHSFAEGFTIIVSFSIAFIVFNTYENLRDDFIPIIGIAYAFAGIFDTLHTLAYKGMGVFPNDVANLSTQMWVIARYLDSIGMLVAGISFYKTIKSFQVLIAYFIVSTSILLAVFQWHMFPVAFIEGQGLTPFKVYSEYTICLILVVSVILLMRHKNRFQPRVYQPLLIFFLISVCTELSLTFYKTSGGWENVIGHLFKITAFYYLYKAVVVTSLKESYDLVRDQARNLHETNATLEEEIMERQVAQKELYQLNAELENKVQERTSELQEINAALEKEILERQAAYEALTASEGRYQDLFNHMQDSFSYRKVILDENGNPVDHEYVAVNPGYERIMGCRATDVVGRRFTEIYPSFENEQFNWIEVLGNVGVTGEPVAFEQYFTATGRWYQVSAYSPKQGYIAVISEEITGRKITEQTLRESEEKFRTAITHAPVPVMLHAEDGEVLLINKCWTEKTGYTIEDIPTTQLWAERAFGEDSLEKISRVSGIYERSSPAFEAEYTITTKYGEKRTWSLWSGPIGKLPDGRRIAVSKAMDITEMRLSEAALRRDEGVLQEINATLEEEIMERQAAQEALRQLNAELEKKVSERTYELQEINATLEEEVMERQAAQEALRQLNAELESKVSERTYELQEINATLEEEVMERQAAQEALRQLNAELESKVSERTYELQEINATLEEEVMERQAAQEALRQLNAELESKVSERTYELQEINATLEEEVMERQAAQEKLSQAHDALLVSDSRYRGLFAHMRKAFIYFEIIGDEAGRIVDHKIVNVNPLFATMFGRKTDDVVGKRLSQVFPKRQQTPFDWIQAFSREVLLDQSADFDQQINVEDKCYQISAYSPEKLYIAVLVADVSEKSRQQERLKYYADAVTTTNTELKSFVNTIAHDFRSPMVNLKGFTSELGYSLAELKQIVHDTESLLPPKVHEKVDQLLDKEVPDAQQFISAAVDRLSRMVDTLLDLSRIGRREMNYKEVDLSEVVDNILKSYHHQIEEKNIVVEVGSLPKIQTDLLAMEQIIGNLVDNAIKYLDPNRQGKIEISYIENPNEYIVSVKDNGRGIDAIDHEKIFDLFRRSGKHDQPGEGLGLAYVRTLVRQLGGRIWVDSELGVGTKMIFTVSKILWS